MTAEERVKDIARYLGEHELSCKKCGLVMDVEECDIEMKVGKRGNPLFSAYCPDCGAYIKRMRNTKTEKIFWRGSTHEVAKLETSLLIWMLQVGYITNERVINAVRHHLKGRIVTNKTIEPMSISEQKEITLKKEIRGLKIKLGEDVKKRELYNHEMLMNAATWDAVQMGKFMTGMKTINKRIAETEKDIKAKEEQIDS